MNALDADESPMPLTNAECVAPTWPPPPGGECAFCDATWIGSSDDECPECGLQSNPQLQTAKDLLT